MSITWDKTWMWHPDFTESDSETAGRSVHFRKKIFVNNAIPSSLRIQITADTRYKLYINQQLITFGPVKGDASLWFFDEIDIGPYLQGGQNIIGVHVLRLFYATNYAPSFPRLPSGGLRIFVPDHVDNIWASQVQSSTEWETAIDQATVLRVDQSEDQFLHIYEYVPTAETALLWTRATLLEYKISTGNRTPWNLSPRLLPPPQLRTVTPSAIRNINSCLPHEPWTGMLKGDGSSLCLKAGTTHSVDLEFSEHTTAFLRFCFRRPPSGGSILRITYSESYEDDPESVPWIRRKRDRCDYDRKLLGPQDLYTLQGQRSTAAGLGYYADENTREIFQPYHFRTFRFIKLEIEVSSSSDLLFEGLEAESFSYPLQVQAEFKVPPGDDVIDSDKLWSTSVRTLKNCTHDCYEDCPFYEQLQYAMDTRSSALFTYNISGDDRLARQAILQIHNSFQASVGLTMSRAPTHRPQFIPFFSLYWICMVNDHLTYFNDVAFVSEFVHVVDAVVGYFHRRIDPKFGLTACDLGPGVWNFVDWAPQWKPHGIPPAIHRTGFSTYGNQLYAYTLRTASELMKAVERPALAEEYLARADRINSALKTHCFDGTFFTDTITTIAKPSADYSQHCQVWAVLSGAVAGEEAQHLLRQSSTRDHFTKESVATSFYTLRAFALAGGSLYHEHFHRFWDPWRFQLRQNVTTWVEDDVSQRSDCHAWGSLPLYEFTSEVAGVKPGGRGWEIVDVKPRLELYKQVDIKVPMGQSGGKTQGIVHVSWRSVPDDTTELSVKLEMHALKEATLRISISHPYITGLFTPSHQVYLVRLSR